MKEVSLASFIRSFRLNVCFKKAADHCGPAPGTREQIQSFRKIALMVLKAYTGFSDKPPTGGTSEQGTYTTRFSVEL